MAETLTIKGRTFTEGDHWLYETPAGTYKRVKVSGVNEYDGTIYVVGVKLDGTEESYWRSDFKSRWTKPHFLTRPWAEERQRRSVQAFWRAKEKARRAAWERKEAERWTAARDARAELPQVKRFIEGADELATQLERRAAEIRRHAENAVHYWGDGYRGTFVEVAGEIAETYAGQRTGYGYGFQQHVKEAAEADAAARRDAKERKEAA